MDISGAVIAKAGAIMPAADWSYTIFRSTT